MPRFGGYDPVAVARGTSVPGNPLFWAVTGERLYLFYSDEARAAFLADPGRIIDARDAQVARGRAHASRADRSDASADGRQRRVAPGDEAGHQEFVRQAPVSAARRRPASVTMPPAAARMAWPAAMSHSRVGASRG